MKHQVMNTEGEGECGSKTSIEYVSGLSAQGGGKRLGWVNVGRKKARHKNWGVGIFEERKGKLEILGRPLGREKQNLWY